MGCFGSRFDKRNSAADDFNTVGLQFVGGAGQKDDKSPLDAVCLKYGDGKEVDEWLKVGPLTMTAEEEGKKIATEAWVALCQQAKFLDGEFGGSDKVQYVNGKYTSKDAIAQIDAVKAFLKEKNPDIEFPEEVKEEAAAEEAPAEGDMAAEEAPAEMEGGDEMEMMEAPDLYKDDSAAYDGFANLPALFLRCMTVSPYFGDIIKSTLIYYEFNFGGKELVPLPKIGLGDFTKNPLAAKEPKTEAWAGVAALTEVPSMPLRLLRPMSGSLDTTVMKILKLSRKSKKVVQSSSQDGLLDGNPKLKPFQEFGKTTVRTQSIRLLSLPKLSAALLSYADFSLKDSTLPKNPLKKRMVSGISPLRITVGITRLSLTGRNGLRPRPRKLPLKQLPLKLLKELVLLLMPVLRRLKKEPRWPWKLPPSELSET